MRAAHMQALQKMDFAKGDPLSFLRTAERVRTHLFDLARIGKIAGPDIIKILCQKLSLKNRLAWNDGRGEAEFRNLDQFGSWLVSRAMAYQNAYAIAAA